MSATQSLRRTSWSLGALGLGIMLSGAAFAAKNVHVNIDPAVSAAGVAPSITGDTNATYQYTVYNGHSVSDTIPVQMCMTGSEAGWTSIAVTFGNQAGPLPGVTAPANQSFLGATTELPDCRSLSFTIATGILTLTDANVSQTFNANFNVADTTPAPATGPNKPQVSFADVKNFKIQVTVLPVESSVSCFLTDSEGNFLMDCAGAPVTESGSSDGRFAIVANKRQVQVATNPGQFYYNLVWHNKTGGTRIVDVDFDRHGLVSKGRQAIHAAVFNGYLDPLTPEEFAAANELGIPEGSDDYVAGVTVPAGSSLLVTYHLEWAGLGTPVPVNCASGCAEANQQAYVTGTVNGDNVTPESCRADAFGYKK